MLRTGLPVPSLLPVPPPPDWATGTGNSPPARNEARSPDSAIKAWEGRASPIMDAVRTQPGLEHVKGTDAELLRKVKVGRTNYYINVALNAILTRTNE